MPSSTNNAPAKVKKVLQVPDLIAWMAENLVHFSFKTVNSNICKGGIRLGKNASLNLPYISVRTMLAKEGQSVGLDYTGNAPNGAPFSQYRQAIGETRRGVTKKDPGILAIVDAVVCADADLRATPATFGTDHVSPRMRQLLLPDADGGYVSISPIGSSGLCGVIDHLVATRRTEVAAYKNATNAEKKNMPMPHSIPRAQGFSIGGGKPQNVGGRMRDMRPIIAMSVPESSAVTRAAWRLYYRGLSLQMPYRCVKAYALWLAGIHEHSTAWTLKVQAEERRLLTPLWDTVLFQRNAALDLLVNHPDIFGEGDKRALSPAVMNVWNRGFLFADCSHQWKSQVAQWFIATLRKYRLETTADGQPVRMDFNDADHARVANLIVTEFAR